MATFTLYKFDERDMLPEDKALAQSLADKFEVPYEELSIAIDIIRRELESLPKINKMLDGAIRDHYARLIAKLCESDIKISTGEEAVEVIMNNPYFESAIKKSIKKYQKLLNSEEITSLSPKLKGLERKAPNEALTKYLRSAKKWHREIILGILLVYFKADPNIKTEAEWNKNRTEAQDYKHYLAETVKNRIK